MGNVGKGDRARRDYLDAIDAIDEAEIRLRNQLRRWKRLRETSRRHLVAGGTAADLQKLMDIKGARVETDDALRDLTSARMDAQAALYRLADAEGLSAAEIGRRWGVSRQFVSQVLHRRAP